MTTLLLSLIAAALLVIAALYWRQVQEDDRHGALEEDKRFTPLLRGINYLLSEEPDRALQEMVQVARLKSEAADVYMALGEMFRAKGEIGRAVRIHQNILARPDISKELRLQAHLALGKDFQTGGLLDRALKQYKKALMVQSTHIGALEACLRIHEQSHEWQEAEEMLSRLEQIKGDLLHPHRAYLFAAMAEAHLPDRAEEAISAAKRAIELDKGCAHAYIVLVKAFLQQGDDRQAEQALQEMRSQAPEHLHLLIPTVIADKKFYQNHGHELLMQQWRAVRDEELALSWLEVVAAQTGDIDPLKEELGFSGSTLRASLRLASLERDRESPLTKQASAWRKKMKHFVCHECGVKVIDLRWQCPQCHAWGTMHAIREEDI